MESKIGKLIPVNLKELKIHEERDFSAWLGENIDSLSEQLDLRLAVEEREANAGSFFIDILAKDERGNVVVIENQLDSSNHDHLGKLLTYMANVEAKVAVWITPKPKEEHKTTFAWLNRTTPRDIEFYLVKVSAYRIDDSRPAPLFSLIIGPSPVVKDMVADASKLVEREKIRKAFWTRLLENSMEQGFDLFSTINPTTDCWLWKSAGKTGVGYQYLARLDSNSGVELYIDVGDKDKNKEIFDTLYADKDAIERDFGGVLEWDRADDKRLSRIRYTLENPGIRNQQNWENVTNDTVDAMKRLHHALAPHIKKLDITI